MIVEIIIIAAVVLGYLILLRSLFNRYSELEELESEREHLHEVIKTLAKQNIERENEIGELHDTLEENNIVIERNTIPKYKIKIKK